MWLSSYVNWCGQNKLYGKWQILSVHAWWHWTRMTMAMVSLDGTLNWVLFSFCEWKTAASVAKVLLTISRPRGVLRGLLSEGLRGSFELFFQPVDVTVSLGLHNAQFCVDIFILITGVFFILEGKEKMAFPLRNLETDRSTVYWLPRGNTSVWPSETPVSGNSSDQYGILAMLIKQILISYHIKHAPKANCLVLHKAAAQKDI